MCKCCTNESRSRLLGASISHISPWSQPFEKLFIEIALVEYFSCLLSNIQSEQSYDHTSHVESQTRNVWFQKICRLPPQRELEIPAGWGGQRPGKFQRREGLDSEITFQGSISFSFRPEFEHCFLPTW